MMLFNKSYCVAEKNTIYAGSDTIVSQLTSDHWLYIYYFLYIQLTSDHWLHIYYFMIYTYKAYPSVFREFPVALVTSKRSKKPNTVRRQKNMYKKCSICIVFENKFSSIFIDISIKWLTNDRRILKAMAYW